MNITLEALQELAGHAKVVTDRGERVGSIGEIYVDDVTGDPDWVTVKTGLFGSAETFVPLDAARIEGSDLVVPYAKDLIKDAPRVEEDGSLSPQEEQVLYRHYSVGGTYGHDDAVRDASGERAGRSDPTTDTAMTRSEERLVVGTHQREAGRARLRKHVVTERVTEVVLVRHEEVRVTREPIDATDLAAAPSDAALREEDYEVVLHAETPVVEKTVVPVERVRLDTVTVTAQERVSADLRKEQIELDDPTRKTRPTTSDVGSTPTAGDAGGTPKSTPKGKKGTRRRR
jgi:stress response protein YsnF